MANPENALDRYVRIPGDRGAFWFRRRDLVQLVSRSSTASRDRRGDPDGSTST